MDTPNMLPFLYSQHNQQPNYQKECVVIPPPVKQDQTPEDLSLAQTAKLCTHALEILNSETSLDSPQIHDQWTHHCIPVNIPLTVYNITSPNYSDENNTYETNLPTTEEPMFGCEVDQEIGIESLLQSESSSTTQTTQRGDGNATSEQFICKYCAKKLARKQNLINHEKVHRDEKPFACLLCGKQFRVKSQLTRHAYTHSKERPFECDECGMRFRHRSNLHTHKGLHKVIRPYKCPVCFKEFRLTTHLSTHFYTHFDFKPYLCSCGKSFQRKWHFNRHLKRNATSGHVAAPRSS